MFDRILVVCTGNICRSPIAEALLQQAHPERSVSSAGTSAMVGWPADPNSVAVCATNGIDLSAHRARQLTAAMMQAADLILTLDGTHSDWIFRRHPEFRGKVHKLGKWQQDEDVPDPYGQRLAVFEAGFQQMRTLVQCWAERLR